MAEATMEKGLSTESSEMKSRQERKMSSDREQRKWRKDRVMRVEKMGAESREIRNGDQLGAAKQINSSNENRFFFLGEKINHAREKTWSSTACVPCKVHACVT